MDFILCFCDIHISVLCVQFLPRLALSPQTVMDGYSDDCKHVRIDRDGDCTRSRTWLNVITVWTRLLKTEMYLVGCLKYLSSAIIWLSNTLDVEIILNYELEGVQTVAIITYSEVLSNCLSAENE